MNRLRDQPRRRGGSHVQRHLRVVALTGGEKHDRDRALSERAITNVAHDADDLDVPRALAIPEQLPERVASPEPSAPSFR